ncbi:uncharacterized protein LOC124595202 [Schistocerca americana]|uniref:uncharacterized protein LOC124595202 n=1 Tax=Schistocerca americana TaxID=7009 RepID=UPI001F4F1BB4|nr:uncharacterized protein LOC124595202 [Schistocerca americana]
MYPAGLATTLLVLLARNVTSSLDCVCNDIDYVTDGICDGEGVIWKIYCEGFDDYWVHETCETLAPPSVAALALARLVPRSWSRGLSPPVEWEAPRPAGAVRRPTGGVPRPAGGSPSPTAEEGCGGALAAFRGLQGQQARELFYIDIPCHIATDCIDSCRVHGLNDVEWNLGTLPNDHLRDSILSPLMHTVRRITRAIIVRRWCYYRRQIKFSVRHLNKTGFLERYSSYRRESAQLLSLGVTHLSHLFIPLAFEHMGNHMSDELLPGWIKNVKRVRDMLHTKLRGWVQDTQFVIDQTVNYKIEEDKNSSGKYILRRPLLSDALLVYHGEYLSFHDDFSELCEVQHPEASQMFGLADALYNFYHRYWYDRALDYRSLDFNQKYKYYTKTVDEEWQLEDRSNATLYVDTGCVQLLVNALDHPTCPLEDLPPERIEQRDQCRVQLWDDMVQRSPHIPVTSYLAYTQRTNVNLCLLAWMTVNSHSICQDVPFSMTQSVQDARCYFDSPDDQSCLQSNDTDAICSVFRALLLLKCRDFSSHKPLEVCAVKLYSDGSYSTVFNATWGEGIYKQYGKPTQRALKYKYGLNSATLKYKDFKIDNLKPLEISFITLNILFRLLTAGVYMYLPQLRNLPGKIFLSFQITGIVQILCSEVVYRMVGVPDLSTAVLIDSALTLLSCFWLNSFCYQMFACIRYLRLPNDLLRAEASQIFRRQALYAVIAWSTVCAACIAFEKTSKHYLMYSRILFLLGITLSISFNLICLGLLGYMYLCTRNSMKQLKIFSGAKFASKKQLLFMSVKAVILSGVGIIIRIGFHQAQGIAQFVYYVHIATMVQGPVLFVCFVCNETTLPLFKNMILSWWDPDIVCHGRELCSAEERNLARTLNEQTLAAEYSL